MGGYVSQVGNEARDALANSQTQFNQTVDQNTVGLNNDLVNQAKTDASSVAGDAGKLAEFQKERDATYKGPAAFEGSEQFQPAKQAFDKAIQATQNTTNEAGQKQILGALQQATAGKQNAGALSFDSALLQADPTARQTLATARASNADLQTGMDVAKLAGADRASKAASQTEATRKAIQDAFSGPNGAQAKLESDIVARSQEQLKQSKEQAVRMTQALASGEQPSAEQLKLLGVSPAQWDMLQSAIFHEKQILGGGSQNYMKDLSGWLSPTGAPEAQITAQNVATPEEYAKYSALNQLMGTSNTFLNDPSQAGKANLDTLDLNYNPLLSKVIGDIKQGEKNGPIAGIPQDWVAPDIIDQFLKGRR